LDNNRSGGVDHETRDGSFSHNGFGDDANGCGNDHEIRGHQELHGDKSVTVDQMDITSYLHSDVAADGSFTETMILQVKGFEHDGSPVSVPGFGTNFGMYFLIDGTGQTTNGMTSFSTMHIALMVDRGNNDGAPGSTEFGGTSFANGTRGDYALATGTLSSATLQVDPDGTRHPNFVETVAPTRAGEEVFGGSLNMSDLLREVLTTPGGPQIFQLDGGKTIQVINGTGFGVAELSPQAPFTLSVGQLNDPGPRSGGCLAALFH
jgi:hypothetical protein